MEEEGVCLRIHVMLMFHLEGYRLTNRFDDLGLLEPGANGNSMCLNISSFAYLAKVLLETWNPEYQIASQWR